MLVVVRVMMILTCSYYDPTRELYVDDRQPFPSRGSTWHPWIIFHRFLVLSCFCLHFYYGKMSLTRVVYVLGVVALDFCNRQYFIGGGWGLWVIFCTQEGTFLQVIPNLWLLFIIGWNEETNFLKPLGDVVIIALHAGLVQFHMCHGHAFF